MNILKHDFSVFWGIIFILGFFGISAILTAFGSVNLPITLVGTFLIILGFFCFLFKLNYLWAALLISSVIYFFVSPFVLNNTSMENYLQKIYRIDNETRVICQHDIPQNRNRLSSCNIPNHPEAQKIANRIINYNDGINILLFIVSVLVIILLPLWKNRTEAPKL